MHQQLRARTHRAAVIGLALVLWLVATLGLVHRTVHNPGLSQSLAERFIGAPASAEDSSHVHVHIGGLFATHGDGDLQCRLYDQLAGGAPLPSLPMLLLPALPPAAVFAFFEGEALARWVALFDARGPPSAR